MDELLAVSHSPGIVGEVLSLDLLGGGATMEMTVRVLDSRPVIIDGAVRHRLRLDARAEAARDGNGQLCQKHRTANAGVSAAEGV